MNKRGIILRVAVVIILLSLGISLLGTYVFAREDDYSKPGTETKTVYGTDDILEMALGLRLSKAEKDYLALFGDYEISIGMHIPTSYVSISYTEGSELTVIAKRYSYTAENGSRVEFIPSLVSLGDSVVIPGVYDDESYIAHFDEPFASEGESASVLYRAEIVLSASLLDTLQNKAYYDAVEWISVLDIKEKEYEEALFQYENDRAEYEAYLDAAAEYESALALYRAYVVENKLYGEKLKEYSQYLSELSDYEEKLSEYLEYESKLKKYNEDYLLYKKYLDDKKNYEINLSLYNAYTEKISKVRTQLDIIDGLKNTSTSLERSVYNAIIGGTVTEVVANKDAIANNTVGVKAETVDMAGNATEKLRELFEGYYALENESGKYTFYTVNYEKFRDSFTDLFIALDKMYENSKVRLALDEKGIKQKYEILLAQLYYVVNALNDSPVKNYDGTAVYDSSYKVNKITGAKPLSLLDNVPYMSDTNSATPIEDGYPREVLKPTLTPVDEPLKPTQVLKPTAPDPVSDPGTPPTEVEKPIEPDAVTDPGNAPEPYVPSPEVSALILAYESGELGDKPRDKVAENGVIVAEINVNKLVIGAETFRVDFMSESGELLSTAYADRGTYAEYTGPRQYKAEDVEATYSFAGWMTSDGQSYDVTSVDRNVTLYPRFEKTLKSYTVIWNIDGTYHRETYSYGELPQYSEIPKKADEGNFEYIFEGWDREITSVTGDAIYTARFRSEPIFVTENGSGAHVYIDGDVTVVDCTSHNDTSFDVSKVITRAAENTAVSIISSRYTVNVSYSEVIRMKEIGVDKIKVENVLLSGGGGYSIRVMLFDESGAPINSNAQRSTRQRNEIRVALDMPASFADSANLRFYYFDQTGEKKYLRANYQNGILSATYICGTEYYAAVEYGVDVIPNDFVEIKADVFAARKGEDVKVILGELPLGTVLDSVYYLDKDGVRHEIASGRFTMQAGGVSLGAEVRFLEYSVKFVADGRIISTQLLKYGESVVLPSAPDKASDSTYSYKFVGWSPSVSETATKDAVYTAVYMKVKLPPPKEPDGLQITPGVLRIIVAIALALGYFALVILPVLIIVTVKLIIRKRRKIRRKRHFDNS